jgi:hypothetical protein
MAISPNPAFAAGQDADGKKCENRPSMPTRYPSIASIDEGTILPSPPPGAVPLFFGGDEESFSVPNARLVRHPLGMLFTRPLTPIERLESTGLLLDKKNYQTILIADGSKVYRKEYTDFAVEAYIYLSENDLLPQCTIKILEPNNELSMTKTVSSVISLNDEKIIASVQDILEAVHSVNYLPEAQKHFSPRTVNKRQLVLTTFSRRRRDKGNITSKLIIIPPDTEYKSPGSVENYTISHNFIEYYIVPGDKVHYEGKLPQEEIATRLHDTVERVRFRVKSTPEETAAWLAVRFHTYFALYLYDESYESINNEDILINWKQVNLLY